MGAREREVDPDHWVVRQGWGYLSDDALLLRQQPEGVEALAFRKPFSIDADVAAAYAELPLGEAGEHPSGKRKRRVDIQSVYADQYRSRCRPVSYSFPALWLRRRAQSVRSTVSGPEIPVGAQWAASV